MSKDEQQEDEETPWADPLIDRVDIGGEFDPSKHISLADGLITALEAGAKRIAPSTEKQPDEGAPIMQHRRQQAQSHDIME